MMNWKKFGDNLERVGTLTDALGDDLNRLQADEAGFQRLSAILKTHCGIDLPLTPKNLSLMASRMRKVLNARKMASYAEYATLLEGGQKGALNEFVTALTTNTTHFFREAEHFEHLKTMLPTLFANKRKAGQPNELRVWCAASSTGQEPYTILMTLLESGALPPNCDIKFLATDIDLTVLEKAARGVYKEEETENIPPLFLSKYFEQDQTNDGSKWRRVLPEFGSKIRFAPLNLVEAWPFEKQFDIIFCRNVLIYFDSVTAQKTIERMAQQLNPGGLLYVGHSESGHVKTRLVRAMSAAAYQKIAASVKT